MVTVGGIVSPVRIRVVRSEEPDTAAAAGDAVELGYKSHDVRHVLGDVIGDDEIEFVIRERVRDVAEVMDNIGGSSRVVIEADRALMLIRSAADIKNLGHRELKLA